MWWLVFPVLLVLLVAVLLIRTLMFKPKAEEEISQTPVAFDTDRAIENLAQLVKCRTVSYQDKSLENPEEFLKLYDVIKERFPYVLENCEKIEIPERALLYRWKGKEDGPATVLMAHFDVVPVNEEGWSMPAFDAVIKDGKMYGRGTLDTKATLNAILTAAESLISYGYTPKNDIYLAFSGNEEIFGGGAPKTVDYFEQNNIEIGMVVDEGGAVVENVFPGLKVPCGLIGIAEKGFMDVKYTAKSNGGHASSPKPDSPMVRISKTILDIEKNPMKSKLTKPVREMFNTLGSHSSFALRMVFANMWLFSPVIDMICKKSGGELNALMRTTVAFTQCEGSSASNVIPPVATAVSNIRVNPDDTVNGVLEYLRDKAKRHDVDVDILYANEPSVVSVTDCKEFNAVCKAVRDTWGCLTSPYLMLACSDSRHYGRVSDKVYKFSAMDLTAEERATIHGHNEAIRLETILRATEFYIRLMVQC